jgi:thymidylate synthase
MNKEEQKYLDMLKDIIENGSERKDRTGIGTHGIFGTQLRFSLDGGKIPMMTSKKTFARGVFEELIFFLRGQTDSKILERKGVNIWQGNTTREFLDKRGLPHYPEGEMGKMYGHQWRSFGKSLLSFQEDQGLLNMKHGVDQIENVIKLLKEDPYSRRIVVNTWNASDLNEMCLAPCHPMFQFYVDNGKLSCSFYMRSSDAFLGLPFNILSYAFLTHILAATVGLEAGELIFMGGDTHVYNNHLDQVRELLTREPYEFPTLKINKKLSSLEDIEELEFTDFEILNYKSHPAIKAPMAV